MSRLADLESNREAILAIADRHGARDVRLFGSVVRREESSDSDVDLLVALDRRRSLLDHIALQQDLEDLLGCKVDVVTERSLHPGLRSRVLSEAVPI